MLNKTIKNIALLNFIVLGSLVFCTHKVHAAPATFTVTNTNDSGSGSLRQAIEDANGNSNGSDMDVISFDISGTSVHTITPDTALPAITEKVTIDGYTQIGASANTTTTPAPMDSVIKIQIDGHNTSGANALLIQANDTVIKGLSVYDFSATGNQFGTIRIESSNVIISGNYVGVHADGLVRATGTNTIGIGGNGSATLVGGNNPGDRNIIFAYGQSTSSAGIFSNGSGLQIYGNYIGIGRDGITDLTPEAADANGITGPYGVGVNIIGGDSYVGGPNANQRNVISGNLVNLELSSSNNYVQGNYIGTDYTGHVNAGITNGIGISTALGENNLIGGTGVGDGNIIAGVEGTGVGIGSIFIQSIPYLLSANKDAILGNSIYDIQVFSLLGVGNSNLGIDIASYVDTSNPADFIPDQYNNFGPNTNDPGDVDTGPNGMINTPVLKSAQQVGNQLTIKYDLDAADSDSNYRIEFFANEESTIFGTGPGQTFIGAVDAATNGTDQTAVITVNGDFTNKAISSTTTAKDAGTPSGYGSTSEMSQNISVGSATDFDSDGSPDAIEALGPNNGDGNNDGIPDSQQPTVTTFEIDHTGIYETLVTSGCSENGTVSSVDVSSLTTADFGKLYPFGLTDFVLNCSRGSTVSVTKYIFTSGTPSNYTVRKYNELNHTYRDVPGSSITSQTVGNARALVATYSITDGGELDDDGTANGVIVDPVGLATTNPFVGISAPNTGFGFSR